MTEKLHQSLSSIMDSAGDDLELPRLLNAMQASPELDQQLSDKWRRYHLVRGVIQGDLRGVQASQVAQMDISGQVMQQLEAESLTPSSKPKEVVHRSEKTQWFRGGALAASVALLVITGVQIFNASLDTPHQNSTPVATQQQASPQQSGQSSQVASSSRPQGPILQVSAPSRSPFEPEVFTGRSLVNYATSEKPRQSLQSPPNKPFSPASSR